MALTFYSHQIFYSCTSSLDVYSIVYPYYGPVLDGSAKYTAIFNEHATGDRMPLMTVLGKFNSFAEAQAACEAHALANQ